MPVKEQIQEKLEAALAPQRLEIVDDSAKHAGHLHNPDNGEGRGETHFTVRVTADVFTGKRLIERHRMINAALAEELAGPVHALAIEAKAPGE